MIAAGPYLLANGNLNAFEELLRRAEEDPMIQTLILVCRLIFEGEFQRKYFLAWSIYR
jgi:hypothetical protein